MASSEEDVSMALDFEAESTREEWMVVTSNANAELGGNSAGYGGNVKEEVVLPEAPTSAEFLAHPELYRPQEAHLREYIEDETALTTAIKIPSELAVRQLLRYGACPNLSSKKGVTPISAASYKGHLPIMKLLIASGADVNALNLSGSTALIQASHFGHPEAVALLLAHNAAADFANTKGTTALMRASQEGWTDISKLLIAARADVNRKNNEGMNALMLASQRGHAEMVSLLVKAGAAMDEQTSQGSTALMLACKRGHEKCVAELVGMGAEIHMLDQRDRSAYDTAVKRQHTNLTCWLSTQMQVRKIQESRRAVRASLLAEMRKACLAGRLRFRPQEIPALLLLEEAKRQIALESSTAAVKRSQPQQPPLATSGSGSSLTSLPTSSVGSGIPLVDPVQVAVSKGLTWPPSAPTSGNPRVTAVNQGFGVKSIHSGSVSSAVIIRSDGSVVIEASLLSPAARAALDSIKEMLKRNRAPSDAVDSPPTTSTSLQQQRPGQTDWQWPFLLFRVMGLPFGIFELIADFMPSPRIWQWSLYRLKKRCSLAPYVALTDISIIIDEILTDSNILAGPDQKQQLIKLSNSPEIQSHLTTKLGMPAELLVSLRTWSDTQSLLSRTTEADVSFKAPFARKMLDVAMQLARWYRQRSSSVKALGLALEVVDADAEGDAQEVVTAGEDNSSDGVMDEDTDQDAQGDEDLDDQGADDSDGDNPGPGLNF